MAWLCSDTYLRGDLRSGEAGVDTCPLCSGGSASLLAASFVLGTVSPQGLCTRSVLCSECCIKLQTPPIPCENELEVGRASCFAPDAWPQTSSLGSCHLSYLDCVSQGVGARPRRSNYFLNVKLKEDRQNCYQGALDGLSFTLVAERRSLLAQSSLTLLFASCLVNPSSQ